MLYLQNLRSWRGTSNLDVIPAVNGEHDLGFSLVLYLTIEIVFLILFRIIFQLGLIVIKTTFLFYLLSLFEDYSCIFNFHARSLIYSSFSITFQCWVPRMSSSTLTVARGRSWSLLDVF
jgi:hypothetical protein